jgi:hypothetical protein
MGAVAAVARHRLFFFPFSPLSLGFHSLPPVLIMPATLSVVSLLGLAAAVAAQSTTLTPLTDKKYTWPNVVSAVPLQDFGIYSGMIFCSHTKSPPNPLVVAPNSASTSVIRLPRTSSPTARRRLLTLSMVRTHLIEPVGVYAKLKFL